MATTGDGPACPRCDSPDPWIPHGPIVQDHRWHLCAACHQVVLIDLKTQTVVREGKP